MGISRIIRDANMSRKPVIIVMRGCAGSGKSTLIKNVMSDAKNTIVVSRDVFRHHFFHAYGMIGSRNEGMITKLVNHAISEAISSGFNVIVDSMNLSKRDIVPLLKVCPRVIVVNINTSLDVLLSRNEVRLPVEARVPADVVKKMYEKFMENDESVRGIPNVTVIDI